MFGSFLKLIYKVMNFTTREGIWVIIVTTENI